MTTPALKPRLAVMKNLLYAGIIGPLLFIAVFLVEGATRPGYSAWRHYVSQLATGDGGWMQVVNFLVCGTLVLAFAIGLRQALRGTRGSIGAPVLLALFAVALLVAGIFSTDPALANIYLGAFSNPGGAPIYYNGTITPNNNIYKFADVAQASPGTAITPGSPDF